MKTFLFSVLFLALSINVHAALVPNGGTCKQNNVCQSGYCSSGRCAPAPLGNACTANNFCQSGYCFNNVCSLKPVGVACSNNNQCQTNLCQSGTCQYVLEGGSCTSSNQCETNYCSGGTCEFAPLGNACSNNYQCQSTLCSNGICNTVALGQSCINNSQCDSNYCFSGVCNLGPIGNSCVNANQCQSNYCGSGACQLAPIGNVCSQNNQCQSNFCYDNNCQNRFQLGTPCSVNEVCQTNICAQGICNLAPLSFHNVNNGRLEFRVAYVYGYGVNGTTAADLPDVWEIQQLAQMVAWYFEDMSPYFHFVGYDILGPFDISSYNLTRDDSVALAARALLDAAESTGAILSQYTNIVYIPSGAIPGQAIMMNHAEVSVSSMRDGDARIAIHEMAHGISHPTLTNLPHLNWGLGHAYALTPNCENTGAIYDDPSFDPYACYVEDYMNDILERDFTGDVMGYNSSSGIFPDPYNNGVFLSARGLMATNRFFFSAFSPSDIIEVNSPSDLPLGTTYTLSPLDTGRVGIGQNYPGPHVIKINRPDGTFVMLSYRKNEGWDSEAYPETWPREGQDPYAATSVHYSQWHNLSGNTLLLKTIGNGETLDISQDKAIMQVSHGPNSVTLQVVARP